MMWSINEGPVSTLTFLSRQLWDLEEAAAADMMWRTNEKKEFVLKRKLFPA